MSAGAERRVAPSRAVRGIAAAMCVAAGIGTVAVLVMAMGVLPDLRWKLRVLLADSPGLATIAIDAPGAMLVVGSYEGEPVAVCAAVAKRCTARYRPEHGMWHWSVIDVTGGVATVGHFTRNRTDVQRVRLDCRCDGDALACALDVQGRSPEHVQERWPVHPACRRGEP